MGVMELGDVRQDIEEAVEMSVVEAQTLFAADAPQHAPAQRQWRGVRGQGGEGLVRHSRVPRRGRGVSAESPGSESRGRGAWAELCGGAGARTPRLIRMCGKVGGERRRTWSRGQSLPVVYRHLTHRPKLSFRALPPAINISTHAPLKSTLNRACWPYYTPRSVISSISDFIEAMGLHHDLQVVQILEPMGKPIQRGGSMGDLSPASTMDELPKSTAPATPPPARTTSATSGCHTLTICDGNVLACGGSSLCEEGETFVAHLGLGEDCEWGEPVATPTPVVTTCLGPAVEVGCGALHSLILCADGALLSFGGGWEGVLGHGDEATLSVPRPIAGLSDVRVDSIAAGGSHSLALVAGALWSWGWNRHGQLGHGDSHARHTPCRVVAAASLRLVQARPPLSGPGCTVWPRLPCTLRLAALLCGLPLPRAHTAPAPNASRQPNPRSPPTPTPIQVAAGSAHSLALCAQGRCHTFGRSHQGQCGHRSAADEPLPRCVPSLERLRSLSASGDMSAACVSAAERYSWGGGELAPKLVVT